MTQSEMPINQGAAARRVPAPTEPLGVAERSRDEQLWNPCDVTLAVSLSGTDAAVETRLRSRFDAARAGAFAAS